MEILNWQIKAVENMDKLIEEVQKARSTTPVSSDKDCLIWMICRVSKRFVRIFTKMMEEKECQV